MRKFRLLKYIEEKEDSIPIWTTFDTDWDKVVFDWWWDINVNFLIKEWYIEEINETLSSFRIWDKVRRDVRYYKKWEKWKVFDYEIITKIWVNSDWEIDQINWNMIEWYRLANNEEIQKYY